MRIIEYTAANPTTVVLYRGLKNELDLFYDSAMVDSPVGYSCWTDSPKLARAYAGDDGYVYEIELPLSEMGKEYIDDQGERSLFYKSDRGAGILGARGEEYLVYHDHRKFSPDLIRLSEF
jgi:hypothetical protein